MDPLRGANVVELFETTEEFFTQIFGARQHDAHMKTRRESIWLAGRQENNRAADLAVRAELARMSEARAQEIAATHGYDTSALWFHLRRYETGCFSRDWNAASQRRLHSRALDIALARHGVLVAAE